MVRAELKRLHSPDVGDLKSFHPGEPEDFGFLLQAMIGPVGVESKESFDMMVCTPEWLRRNHAATEIIVGRHHLIVCKYDYESLVSYISEFVKQCTGDSWSEVADKLGRLGKWEFEDYQRLPSSNQ